MPCPPCLARYAALALRLARLARRHDCFVRHVVMSTFMFTSTSTPCIRPRPRLVHVHVHASTTARSRIDISCYSLPLHTSRESRPYTTIHRALTCVITRSHRRPSLPLLSLHSGSVFRLRCSAARRSWSSTASADAPRLGPRLMRLPQAGRLFAVAVLLLYVLDVGVALQDCINYLVVLM